MKETERQKQDITQEQRGTEATADVSGENSGNHPNEHNNNDSNINNYIQNLDVANVLAVDLSTLDNHQSYIDPSIAVAYKRAALEAQRARSQGGIQGADNSTVLQSDLQQRYISEIPPVPPGLDPKKTCPFCQRTFSHPGSMGRHLDLKKGTKLHPAELIEKMRADVKRRGDVEQVKQRKRIRAQKYNAREDVRERSKAKRRVREKINRARKSALNKFILRLGKPQLQPHPTFPRLVLYFLSPNQWPHDPPTLETYRLLCGFLNTIFLDGKQGEDVRFYDEIMQKVHTASENWLTLSDAAKQETWIRELRRAAEDSLTNISLYDLSNREEWITEEAHRTIEANPKDGSDSNSDDEQEQEDNPSLKEGSQNEGNNSNNETYYNQEELAAVAEAVVNNSNQHHNHNHSQEEHITPREEPSRISSSKVVDPQLMT